MTESVEEPARPSTIGRVSETDRVKAFSDAVFAIVITLLVLELRVPAYDPGGLFEGLLDEWPSYLAFVLSFGYVGVIWLNHHGGLRLVGGMTRALNWINLGLLFCAVIVPFATSVLASALARENDDHDRRVAIVFYAASAALMALPWSLFFGYLRRHPELLAAGATVPYVRRQSFRPLVGLVLYGLSGVLGWFVDPLLGLVLVIGTVAYHAVTSEGRHDGRRGRTRG